MKKHFFYAAMAVALMASCTSEDDLSVNPVNPTPDAEEEKVAINLGVKTPNITVSRGTGTVGNVENETSNLGWNSQSLNLVMIDRATDSLAMDNGSYIFNNLIFRAPRKDAPANEQYIRIYNENTTPPVIFDEEQDKGLIQHKYYPVNGAFDFYGYHTDDANGTLSVDANNSEEIKVTDITINGSQDILSAKTIQIPATKPNDSEEEGGEYLTQNIGNDVNWSDMNAKQFSARTARNGFTPILDFKHNLARLKFYVKSGNPEAGAVYNKNDQGTYVKRQTSTVTYTDTKDQPKTYEGLANGAIYITGIAAEDLNDKIFLDLKKDSAYVQDAASLVDFSLMSTDTTTTTSTAPLRNLVTLYPVAPMFPKNAKLQGAQIEGGVAYQDSTAIGESLMFLPNGASETNIVLALDLVQNVIDTTNELDNGAQTFIAKPSFSRINLPANKVLVSGDVSTGNAVYAQKFEPGKSYNVYITIYSLEEIVVSAQLTEWKDGGDVNLDIEDDVVTQ